ncbi:hypothetical protein JOM56_009386 [Amanita muscaria]
MTLQEESSGTLIVCRALGKESIKVIDATTIDLVVGMIPFPLSSSEKNQPEIINRYSNTFYIAEKPCTGVSMIEGSETSGNDGPEENNNSDDDSDDELSSLDTRKMESFIADVQAYIAELPYVLSQFHSMTHNEGKKEIHKIITSGQVLLHLATQLARNLPEEPQSGGKLAESQDYDISDHVLMREQSCTGVAINLIMMKIMMKTDKAVPVSRQLLLG